MEGFHWEMSSLSRERTSDSRYGLREQAKCSARFREYTESEASRKSPIKRKSPNKKANTLMEVDGKPQQIRYSSGASGQKANIVASPDEYGEFSASSYSQRTAANTDGVVQQQEYIGSSQYQDVDQSINVDDAYESLAYHHDDQGTVTNPQKSYALSSTASLRAPQGVFVDNSRGVNQRTRIRTQHSDLTESIRENLRRLKNVLKLPKARRWVYCEFFYSSIDEQLFNAENEFSQLLREYFPNLKTRWLRRPEWRTIRRLVGKPRRCSAAFLEEERHQLEIKRTKIKQICDGSVVLDGNMDFSDLPPVLPRPLAVGVKIYARVRYPKDGIYAGTIDAILPEGYRVIFEKEEMLQPTVVRGTEVMSDTTNELLPLSYFLEQNKAALPSALKITGTPILPGGKILTDRSHTHRNDVVMASATKQLGVVGAKKSKDEKVGNFPVRLLVILVKLSKLLEAKRGLVRQLAELNNEAERVNLISDQYHFTFQEKYAQVVVDLEQLNKQMNTYMQGVHEYHNQLLPQLSEVSVISRPEALRKVSMSHAVQIVKHCRNQMNSHIHSKRAMDLITNLTSLLLQVRQLGQQKCTPLDLQSLNESINEIRSQIMPQNLGTFQDCVEVHMKQIHNMMLNNSAV
ncbi:unnamed protein product, partial [Mesorhabditis belari]|uniref:DIRP domain-containing protein n=1 Tax=Mesorhabditis belari TaxID=2138241 RepID=A0AAF3E8C9_9BILA